MSKDNSIKNYEILKFRSSFVQLNRGLTKRLPKLTER